jgi:hypothetical protein
VRSSSFLSRCGGSGRAFPFARDEILVVGMAMEMGARRLSILSFALNASISALSSFSVMDFRCLGEVVATGDLAEPELAF